MRRPALLSSLRSKGVRLWLENGELRYKAPKGALTHEDMDSLRAQGSEIVSLLKKTVALPPKLGPRREFGWVPVTFSQLAHFHSARLHERPSVRQLASVIRLSGTLDCSLLRRSLAEIVERHEALRVQIAVEDSVPAQRILAAPDYELGVHDFSGLPRDRRDAEVERLVTRLILGPVDISSDALFVAHVVKTGREEHLLIVAMEHMISDAFSMNIFLRDLLAGYGRFAGRSCAASPPIATQFPDYAAWQRSCHPWWMAEHAGYWTERLQGCERVRFPSGQGSSLSAAAGWGTVPVQMGAELKAELLVWCRSQRTTLVMAVFTAYAALVLRWCDVGDCVVRYQTDGRTVPTVENTIGFFAAILHLRIQLGVEDTWIDLIQRVTEEYCAANVHADACYLDAQMPRSTFARNCFFNWVPQELKGGLVQRIGCETGLLAEPVRFTNPVLRQYQRDSEPGMLLYDTDAGVVGGVHFPLDRFEPKIMERFASNFSLFLNSLLRDPRQRIYNICLR